MAKSKVGKLNKEDLQSLGTTAALFGLAAAVTYLIENLASLNMDEVQLQAVTFALGMFLKYLQKLLSDGR